VSDDPLFRELLGELAGALTLLPDKPEETAENTLRALWLFVLGRPCSAIAAQHPSLNALDANAEARLRVLIRQRLAGIPLAHLVGRQHFMGLEMLAGPDALVPRVETELLARVAIDLATEMQDGSNALTVVDVCTGSGNVALAIAHRIPTAAVFAADLSTGAIDLARRNAAHTGLADRVQFAAGDLLAPFNDAPWVGTVDLLTCNPPYISSAKVGDMPAEIAAHEPALAFDGGPFGVSILFKLLQDAPRFLRSGGWLAFEVGLGQGPSMARRLTTNTSFGNVRQHADAAGHVRAISARRQ
jgi:release factor glutamine methyltransferase